MAAATNLAIIPLAEGAVPPVRISSPESFPPQAALTLYSIEDQLSALIESVDMVTADQEDEFAACIGDALIRAVEKRDSMGRFLAHVEAQIGFADEEIRRLEERKRTFTRVLERSEAYVVRVIQSLGLDAKGRWQKLEGHTVTFSLRKQPPSVAVVDESRVPVAYRKATIRMAAPLWEALLKAVDVELAGRLADEGKRSDEVSKSLVKEAIEGGTEVPGAHLVTDGVKLKRG